jgi:hypothetical protein
MRDKPTGFPVPDDLGQSAYVARDDGACRKCGLHGDEAERFLPTGWDQDGVGFLDPRVNVAGRDPAWEGDVPGRRAERFGLCEEARTFGAIPGDPYFTGFRIQRMDAGESLQGDMETLGFDEAPKGGEPEGFGFRTRLLSGSDWRDREAVGDAGEGVVDARLEGGEFSLLGA